METGYEYEMAYTNDIFPLVPERAPLTGGRVLPGTGHCRGHRITMAF